MRMETIRVKGRDGLRILKELIRRGNATKIIVKNGEGRVVLHVPSTLLAAGAFIAPFLAGAGVVLALLTECTIEVEKKWTSSSDVVKSELKVADSDGCSKEEDAVNSDSEDSKESESKPK
ncbi:DUF4342 domain-containing protein [bacterium]|jgi:hypothetical protein|nr:DUF4342 domain-containing protein [bacterium]